MLNRWILSLSVLCAAGVSSTAQTSWTWFVDAVVAESGNPGAFDVSLGLRAETPSDSGRLGNANLRGSASVDLYGFGSDYAPFVLYATALTEATLTPRADGWQFNLAFDGLAGEGPDIDTAGMTIATLRFYIANHEGRSGFAFTPLQQSYQDNNVMRVEVAFNDDGGDVDIHSVTTGVPDENVIPKAFCLYPNYPNPFNPNTHFIYDLPERSQVRITLLSLNGATVKVIHDGITEAGRHTAAWSGLDASGRPVASGVYLLRLDADSQSSTRKITLLR